MKNKPDLPKPTPRTGHLLKEQRSAEYLLTEPAFLPEHLLTESVSAKYLRTESVFLAEHLLTEYLLSCITTFWNTLRVGQNQNKSRPAAIKGLHPLPTLGNPKAIEATQHS